MRGQLDGQRGQDSATAADWRAACRQKNGTEYGKMVACVAPCVRPTHTVRAVGSGGDFLACAGTVWARMGLLEGACVQERAHKEASAGCNDFVEADCVRHGCEHVESGCGVCSAYISRDVAARALCTGLGFSAWSLRPGVELA